MPFISLGVAMSFVDATIVNVAVPTVGVMPPVELVVAHQGQSVLTAS